MTCKGSGVGKMAISHLDDAHIARQIMAIRGYCGIQNTFIEFLLLAELPIIIEQANGLIPGIRREIILSHKIALPPLLEQQRIVVAIESAFALIEEIENSKGDLLAAVTAAKSKILSLAISGKLVSQDPNDEPASVLLEQINTERNALVGKGKIKKSTAIPAVKTADNSHYQRLYGEVESELPNNWELVLLGDFCIHTFSGKSPVYVKTVTQYSVIGQQANQEYGIDLKYTKYTNDDFWTTMPDDYFLRDNDVLLNTLGTGTLGRSGIIKNLSKRILTDGHLFVYRSLNETTSKFLYYIFRANQKNIEEMSSGTTNQRFLKLSETKQWLIPIPPLAEQKRIVAAIEAAFEQLDEIFGVLN